MPTILLNNIRPGGKSLTNLRVGSTEVKYVKRGDGKLFYDTLSHYTYGTPSVNLSYPSGNTSAAGGTKSPTLSYSLTKTPVGYSGTNYTASSVTSGATAVYEVTSGSATVNLTSGVVTWGSNTSISERQATIKVTITLNGKSNSTTATVKLNGDTVSSSSISLSSNNYTTTASECASSGGSCTITAKVTKNWVSGDVTYDKPSLTSSNASFTVGTINSSYLATGTWAASSSTSRRNTTITATYSGATNKTLTLYQAANTNTTTEYENPVIESVTAADIPAGGGTTDNTYYTVRFYLRKRTKYADGTYSDWSYAYSSGSTATSTMITASTTLSGSDLETIHVARTKKGSINITVTANSKTSSAKSVDIYQALNKIEGTTISNFYIPYFGYGDMFTPLGGIGDAMNRYDSSTAKPYIPDNFYATSSDRYTSGKYKSNSITVPKSSCTFSFTIAAGSYFNLNTSNGNLSAKYENLYNQSCYTDTVVMYVKYDGTNYSISTVVGQRGYHSSYGEGACFRVNPSYLGGYYICSTSSSTPSYSYAYRQYGAFYISSNFEFGMGVYVPVYGNSTLKYILGIDSNGDNTQIYSYDLTVYVYLQSGTAPNWVWTRAGSFTFSSSMNVIEINLRGLL